MSLYTITHHTEYHYEEDVILGHNQILMTPPSNEDQTCFSHETLIDPLPDCYRERTDYFGNNTRYFSIERPHRHLKVTAVSKVQTAPARSTSLDDSPAWEETADSIQKSNDISCIESSLPSHFTPLQSQSSAQEILQNCFPPGRPVLRGAMDLALLVKKEFIYDTKATHILTPLARVLRTKRGVCQDFTHLCLALLRSLGLSARYVSGYIETIAPAGRPKLQGSDASHAWFSVYVPSLGWFDFDPTNGQARSEQYIETAVGRDYADVAPLKGILFGGGSNTMKVAVDVLPDLRP
ncbi:MAG: transglutaminase family protein [Spirochaetales bacterium]|nr:transglutaminase family protein [Spirochaetales bacterium]